MECGDTILLFLTHIVMALQVCTHLNFNIYSLEPDWNPLKCSGNCTVFIHADQDVAEGSPEPRTDGGSGMGCS